MLWTACVKNVQMNLTVKTYVRFTPVPSIVVTSVLPSLNWNTPLGSSDARMLIIAMLFVGEMTASPIVRNECVFPKQCYLVLAVK